MNVLFVCSGNVSRSFLAESLMKKEMEALDRGSISVSSAGLFAYPGSPPDPVMVEYLAEKGIQAPQHQARRLAGENVHWADLILVMEKEHARLIEESWPEAKGKIELLGRYISGDQAPDDIIDPYGGSPYDYRLAQAQITMAIKSLAKALATRQEQDFHG